MDKTICEIVREMEENDKIGNVTLSKFVKVNMRENIDRTEAYINSKHMSGEKDYLGRDKPFFNIVIAAVNVWYRATDIDRKDIKVRPGNEKQRIQALLATIYQQEWMKKQNFGQFLNDWGLCLSRHGSSVVEFIEKGGELIPSVLDWNTIIIDPIDFENNLLIKKVWLTPAQMKRNKLYNQDYVDEIIESTTTRKTIDGTTKDNKDDYILVYEVHGELPLELITDDENDSETYVQQMHVVCFAKSSSDKKYDDYTLYRGRMRKSPHMITHLLKKDGQTYSGGAVANLFEAQTMVNYSEKQMKDQLDLASKIVFQSSDEGIAGKNVTTDIENGQILKHKVNEPMTMLNNKPDIGAVQEFKADWQNIANQINNISESMLGQNAPSGTAWRQVQALLQESHSLFELMTETKGLYLIKMMTDFVIPYVKKQLENSDVLSAKLEDHMIKQIDAMYIPAEVTKRLNQKKIDTILSGQMYDPTQEAGDRTTIEQAVKGELFGNERFFAPSDIKKKTWKKMFEGLEWNLDIDVTGEAKDIQGAMATLSTVIQILASNPGAMQDPNIKMLVGKTLDLSGTVSPLEFQTTQQMPQPQMQPQQPIMAGMPTNQ